MSRRPGRQKIAGVRMMRRLTVGFVVLVLAGGVLLGCQSSQVRRERTVNVHRPFILARSLQDVIDMQSSYEVSADE